MAEVKMSDMPGNSDVSKVKDEAAIKEPKDPVVKGKVKTKKRSAFREATGEIVKAEVGDIKNHVIFEVLIPAIRDTIVNGIEGAVEMAFYPDGRRGRRTSRGGSGFSYSRGDYTNYSRISGRDQRRDEPSYARRESRSGDDIICETRGDAEEILDALQDQLERYGVVSVADLNEFIGKTGSYTDNKWGWYNLSKACSRRNAFGGGYLVVLPRPEPLN